MNKRGRPALPGTPEQKKQRAKDLRREKITAISVPRDVHEELRNYRIKLSGKLGVELTIGQTLKYLIRHAK